MRRRTYLKFSCAGKSWLKNVILCRNRAETCGLKPLLFLVKYWGFKPWARIQNA
jgi:hypothetical protein